MKPVRCLTALGCCLALSLTGCATRAPVVSTHLSQTEPSQQELSQVPFFAQEKYQCGPAALATVLAHSGVAITPAELVPRVYIPDRRGSLQVELLGASRRYRRIPYVIEPSPASLLTWLQDGRPVLVLQNLALDAYPVWHYAVVIGYSTADDTLILRSGTTERLAVPASRFMRTWKRAERWGLVVLRPDEMPPPAQRDAYLRAVASFEAVVGAETALAAYRAAADRWPESLVARFGLANALHASGRNHEAEAAYRVLLASRPDHLPALNNLAMVLADRGCLAEALAIIERAIHLNGAKGTLAQTLRRSRGEILAAQQRVSPAYGTAGHGITCCSPACPEATRKRARSR